MHRYLFLSGGWLHLQLSNSQRFAARFFGGVGSHPFVFVPFDKRGGEAPKGAGAERRTPWPVLRSGRSLQRKGSPASDVGRRASRRSTAAFAETTKRRLISSGPRFLARGHLRPDPVQQAPCGRVVVPNGRSPGTARVRKDSDALRPRGPHRPGLAEDLRNSSGSPAPRVRFCAESPALPLGSSRLGSLRESAPQWTR